MTIEQQLSSWIRETFATVFPDVELPGKAVRVERTKDAKFGDYQCNAAMALAKPLGNNPRAIATEVQEKAELPEHIEKIDIAGPGFINLFLNPAWLAEQAAQGVPQVPQIGEGQTVVMDYSGPNVAKSMHIGHIRSTVIGSTLDKLYRSVGYTVIADNHIGDWGTQFGLLIMGYRNFVNEAALKEDPIGELERIYVESQGRAKEDEDWQQAARDELVKLQQGDADNRALWQQFIDWSMPVFDAMYKRLDVSFELTRGESYYNESLPTVVADLLAAGLLQESEGAQIVDLEADKLNIAIVQKKDGGYNYTTSDLATVRSRVEEFSPAKIIYLSDERQQLHFKQFFKISEKMSWVASDVLQHVWFGLMRLPEGTFSTRSGNVIALDALLNEAEERAYAIIQEKNPEMPEEEKREVASAVGVGAVKYADLSQNPQSLVTFTWEKAMALDGNSGPYLQYAQARTSKVVRDFKERFPEVDLDGTALQVMEAEERELALKVLQYPEAVLSAVNNYRPNFLCDYLYELAGLLNAYYQKYRIFGEDEALAVNRVKFNNLGGEVIRAGLKLLGIGSPERI